MSTKKTRQAEATEIRNALVLLLQIDASKFKDVVLERLLRARLRGIGVVDCCPRCGGSGRFSFNMLDGDRCYGCDGRGELVPPLSHPRTVERAQAAVAAGELTRYLQLRRVVGEAREALSPLLREAETVWKEIHRICRERSGFTQGRDTDVTVHSHAFRIICEANEVHQRGWDVETAVSCKKIDPEYGLLWARAIVEDEVRELRALKALAETATVEYLRSPVHPPFPCHFCHRQLYVFADAKSGGRVKCTHPWTMDKSAGCGFENTVP